MSTKIVAARLATSAGVTTVITRASSPGNIGKITQHIEASKSPASLLTQANNSNEDPQQQQQSSEDTLARSTTSLQSLDFAAARRQVPLHTRFLPSPHPVRDRSFWILHGLKPHGDVYIDAGCYKALLNKAGLLPVGVVDVEGTFSGHECVRLLVVEKNVGGGGGSSSTESKSWHGEPQDVGRAIVNYPSVDIHRVKGHQSKEIEGLLGYADSGYVAEREHVTLFRRESRPQTPTPMGSGILTTE